MNLFEHDMETKILFKLIKQPYKNFLVLNFLVGDAKLNSSRHNAYPS